MAILDRVPATSYFLVSAIFHYLGPSLAVLLFGRVQVLGVAWFRIASAAALFALWRRPWHLVHGLTWRQRGILAALGGVLAGMNVAFYLAIGRLPLATVGAIEFLGTVLIAAAGLRTWRNVAALTITTGGVAALTEVRLVAHPLGFVLAFANCAAFMLYVVLGHHIANSRRSDGAGRGRLDGVDQLGAAMIIASIAVTPLGLAPAWPAFSRPALALVGIGVGICSSVIPYVTDQLAMARLPRSTFALMLALLPASAAVMGFLILHQRPSLVELLGIGLVVGGVALHQSADAERRGGLRERDHLT